MRIGSPTRWDATALTARLAEYRWFIVEPDRAQWDVYLTYDDRATEEVLDKIHEWMGERGLEASAVEIGDPR